MQLARGSIIFAPMIATLTFRRPTDALNMARLILEGYSDQRVFALSGELGAGKTTLIKAFCETLGVKDKTSSPSFAIVNEYRGNAGNPVYHFDLYRLRAAAELDGIGFSEYVDSGNYCFVEWPELGMEIMPPDTVLLDISVSENGARTLRLSRRS